MEQLEQMYNEKKQRAGTYDRKIFTYYFKRNYNKKQLFNRNPDFEDYYPIDRAILRQLQRRGCKWIIGYIKDKLEIRHKKRIKFQDFLKYSEKINFDIHLKKQGWGEQRACHKSFFEDI
jgi:hypothetical protein